MKIFIDPRLRASNYSRVIWSLDECKKRWACCRERWLIVIYLSLLLSSYQLSLGSKQHRLNECQTIDNACTFEFNKKSLQNCSVARFYKETYPTRKVHETMQRVSNRVNDIFGLINLRNPQPNFSVILFLEDSILRKCLKNFIYHIRFNRYRKNTLRRNAFIHACTSFASRVHAWNKGVPSKWVFTVPEKKISTLITEFDFMRLR